MADIVSDPDHELGQGRPRSLIFFRIFVFIVSAAAIAGVVAAHFQLEGDPLAPALAIGAVVGLAISVQAMLALIQARIASERERTEAVWQTRQAEMQKVAGRDELTELQNRRFFYERMHEELKARDKDASLNRVTRVMREASLQGVSRRKGVKTTARFISQTGALISTLPMKCRIPESFYGILFLGLAPSFALALFCKIPPARLCCPRFPRQV